MNDLYELVVNQQWQVAISHIHALADGDAADQTFFQDQPGFTTIMWACIRSAPVELVQLMIAKAKLDSRKRCLLAIITNNSGRTALHWAACNHSDTAVLELLIREHPLALQTINNFGRTPLQYAVDSNRPAPIISLLTDTTNALAACDYAILATLVHGDERTLPCLALTPDRLAVRVSLLLCIKHGYVYVRRSKRRRTETVALDTKLAFEALNDNVWSLIMTFL